MRFLHPELAWWLALALACVGVLQWTLRRRFAASTVVIWLRARRYRASLLRQLPVAGLVVALVLVGLALMEPVIPFSQGEVQSRGLDIAMVLDLSSSMQEEMDAGPLVLDPAAARRRPHRTRLEATKEAIRAFVSGRPDDRIGLVVFSDHAYVVSPLTFDHEYLVRYVDMVDDRIIQGEGQTAIGDGLGLANYLLSRQSKGSERASQVVVLFTDGENNRGRNPLEVLNESHDANIRVHLVGVDLREEIRGKPEVQRLLDTVQRFGGQYFNASSERDLLAASSAIDALEKSVLVNKVYAHDTPVYQWFAVPALVCLALAMGLRAMPYFVDLT